MFSSRTHWNTDPNRLFRLVSEKRLRGESIIDLTESNPTHCGFSYPKEEIRNAIADESILSYQPEPRGLLSARRAVAEYYAGLGVSIAPEQIVLTASTSEAYSFLLKLLCNVDDEVIVPRPSYPLFEYLCQLNDVVLRHYPLIYDGEWHIDFSSLQSVITERTRAFVLVHPNNPTGSYLKQDEFDEICSLAVRHHCALIVDEVFRPYAFSPDIQRANITISNYPILMFSLNGLSKLLGLPQLKLSWIVVHGTHQEREEALRLLDIISDTYLSVNIPAQVALPRLLQHSHDMSEQIRVRVLMNYRLLQKYFADSSASVFQSEGGWYAILQLPQIFSDDDWVEHILARQNILVQPGHYFDMEKTSCIVVSLLPPLSLFEDTIKQLRQCINK